LLCHIYTHIKETFANMVCEEHADKTSHVKYPI
jgi:hypothetical protein